MSSNGFTSSFLTYSSKGSSTLASVSTSVTSWILSHASWMSAVVSYSCCYYLYFNFAPLASSNLLSISSSSSLMSTVPSIISAFSILANVHSVVSQLLHQQPTVFTYLQCTTVHCKQTSESQLSFYATSPIFSGPRLILVIWFNCGMLTQPFCPAERAV